MSTDVLRPSDLDGLAARGVNREEVERQLALLREPPPRIRLLRPCRVGDGILRLEPDEAKSLETLQEAAAAAGRFTKFVPASGAATRMFAELSLYHHGERRGTPWEAIRQAALDGDGAAATLVRVVEALDRLPFPVTARAGHAELLAALLDAGGLDYGSIPKGLLPFHDYGSERRTALEEHLVEAAEYVRDATGRCRLHLTVSAEHHRRFEAFLARVLPDRERRLAVRFEIGLSTQRPSTDTIAADGAGAPLRDEHGALVFRPGGHGALIENLASLGADLVYLKNIDNVQPDSRRAVAVAWKRALGGLLVRIVRRRDELLTRLRSEASSAGLEDARAFAVSRLHAELDGRYDASPPETRRRMLVDRLDRPIRVCGVVPNTGEPGGGPFWVTGSDGSATLQIVEAAEVDRDDPEQRAILRAATHFNPVDVVCALRDRTGRPYDLERFVDARAVIVTSKPMLGGQQARALERPGLWNGAMAGWNTIFVEVPLDTFSPVKSVLDLLRDEHQPPRS